MKIQLQKRASFYFAVLAFLMVNLGWGQVDISNCPAGTVVSNQMTFNTTNFTLRGLMLTLLVTLLGGYILIIL